ncbi:DUF3768 domain-containing protein [Sandarakinorhabdus sp.]|uniref:DUF3768 domain-containing protein n=1 Tax=Sandarakinorhabdus sp. TaxID=1916663 RepID=UPI00286E6591|nr:DUF3768 domain-containing protein [Sandarakinorhabdus sp.]
MLGSDQENRALLTTQRIRQLNDTFRRTGKGGRVFMTDGVMSLSPATRVALAAAVRVFDDFTPGNDPHQEHDFGALSVAGHRLFWKIDYYDTALTYRSPDPSDPAVTTRVLTILLASEY